MRVHSIRISAFKGLDVTIPWASAVVLFGANDSGKTNILEGLLGIFAEQAELRVERYPLPGNEGIDVELLVELDSLEVPGHSDQELFVRWMGPLIRAVDAEAPEAWLSLKESLVALNELAGSERPPAVAELIDDFRAVIAEEWTTDDGETEPADGESGRVAAVSSRWFRVDWLSVSWLAPSADNPDDPRVWSEFIDLGEPDAIDNSLIRAIPVDTSRAGFKDLYDRLQRFIEDELEYREYYESRVSPEPLVRADFVARYRFRPVSFRDDWLEREEDRVSLKTSIEQACTDLAISVNELAPRFVTSSYEIQIVPHLPDEWRMLEGRRVSIRLRPHGQTEDFDLEVASSGIGAWTSYSVSEAIRIASEERHRQFPRQGSQAQLASTTVYVFDEPERHLHPLAQEEAAAWVASRARDGANIWLATHAVPFLRLDTGDVEYLKVARRTDWTTLVEPITTDILGAVAESASSLGLPEVALIQLTRGWLIVEGEHDRRVLDAIYGHELRQVGVRILPLRGAGRAKASFLNLEALAPLGIPFFVLLDNARAGAVERGEIPPTSRTEEERIVEQLIRLRESEGVDIEVFGLPYPDIFCALPIEAVAQVARNNGGSSEAASSWTKLIEDYDRTRTEVEHRGEKGPTFKSFALGTLGLRGWNPDRFVDEVLGSFDGSPREGDPLARTVSRIAAVIDDRTSTVELPRD